MTIKIVLNKKEHLNASFVKNKTYCQSSTKGHASNSKVDNALEKGR